VDLVGAGGLDPGDLLGEGAILITALLYRNSLDCDGGSLSGGGGAPR
jgi:hypothetical protein